MSRGPRSATATPSVDDLWIAAIALSITGVAAGIVQTVGTAAVVDSAHDEERGVAIALSGPSERWSISPVGLSHGAPPWCWHTTVSICELCIPSSTSR